MAAEPGRTPAPTPVATPAIDPSVRTIAPIRDTELPRLSIAPVAPETIRGRRIALTVVVVLALFTVLWIAAPLWVGIALGTVMAFTGQPSFRKLSARLGDRRTLAAAITTMVGGLLTTIVGALCVYVVTRELVGIGGLLQSKMASGSLVELIGQGGASFVDRLGIPRAEVMARLRHELSHASESAASAIGILLQATTSALLTLVIALMTMYYVLLEWPNIALRLERLLPLDPRHTRALMLEFRDVGRSSFVGTVATAIVQGVLGGIGYAMCGLSNSITLGFLTAIASFLPIVGTSLVWAPVAVYLVASGSALRGVFMVLWGLVIVMALSDYVIRPRLVGARGDTHPLLMLVALLGGLEVLGLAGLIVAPILMSLFLAALRIYEREIATASALHRAAAARASSKDT